ncbi:hypothetical protein ACIOJE_04885 [Kitasatospora sp. NPDC087861]|uniref:hypothetical protein n=1 Tax=Kitasatospora sp. NPDC087861 TaxID=3364070 RepID=UPI0038158A75
MRRHVQTGQRGTGDALAGGGVRTAVPLQARDRAVREPAGGQRRDQPGCAPGRCAQAAGRGPQQAPGQHDRVIRHAPTAVAACLRAVTRGINLPTDEGLAVEAACFAATVPTDGVRAGLRRFLDRPAEGPGV